MNGDRRESGIALMRICVNAMMRCAAFLLEVDSIK